LGDVTAGENTRQSVIAMWGLRSRAAQCGSVFVTGSVDFAAAFALPDGLGHRGGRTKVVRHWDKKILQTEQSR